MSEVYDYIVIGSGFGGSVSAMRLAEKGYRVLVLESGRRYEDKDFPKTSRTVKKWLFCPELGLHGIMRMSFFKDAFFLSGAGVGGGSLVYGNTLLTPPESFYKDPQWAGIEDWAKTLAPYYETAKRMLGVTRNPYRDEKDDALYTIAKEMGREHTYHQTNVGVFFGEPGVPVSDPFFEGKGPERSGCTYCGSCMTGCRVGAKNTLRKNYLWMAEKLGVKITAETRVTKVYPKDGGYTVEARQGTTLLRPGKAVTFRAKGIVFSAGVLGTVRLLMEMKAEGYLPKLSERVGDVVRTNSEAFGGVSVQKDVDFSKGIAITSGFYPSDDTHVEIVRYGEGSDMIGGISSIMVGGGVLPVRWAKFLWQASRHPIQFLQSLRFKNWAKRNIILLVMQNRDNHMKMVWRRRWYWPFAKAMVTVVEPEDKAPAFIPLANEVSKRYAKKLGGFPVGALPEILLNKSSTAHILGGAVIGSAPETGVINGRNEVFGYDNMYVVDGSMIPANLGVNPSLTITAMAEHAMSHIPRKKGSEVGCDGVAATLRLKPELVH